MILDDAVQHGIVKEGTMRSLIERLEAMPEEVVTRDDGSMDWVDTPSDKFVGFVCNVIKAGGPSALDQVKKTAKEYGVKIVKVIGDQIHVKLPGGKYGFFTPMGPRADRSYRWAPAAASNYKPDSDFMKGR